VSEALVAARWAEWRLERSDMTSTPPAAAGASAHSRGPESHNVRPTEGAAPARVCLAWKGHRLIRPEA